MKRIFFIFCILLLSSPGFPQVGEIVDVILLTGETVQGAEIEQREDKYIFKYVDESNAIAEIEPTKIGFVHSPSAFYIMDLFLGSIPVDKFVKVLADQYNHFQKEIDFTINTQNVKTLQNRNPGNFFEVNGSEHIFKFNFKLINDTRHLSDDLFFRFSNFEVIPKELEINSLLMDMSKAYNFSIFPRLVKPDGTKVPLPYLQTGRLQNYAYVSVPEVYNELILNPENTIEFYVAITRISPIRELVHFNVIDNFNGVLGTVHSLTVNQKKSGWNFQEKAIELKWQTDIPNIDYFNIYRGEKTLFGKETATLLTTVPKTERSYIDTEVEYNHKYYYKVLTVNTDGTTSDPSNEDHRYVYYDSHKLDLGKTFVSELGVEYVFDGVVSALDGLLSGSKVTRETEGNKMLLDKGITDSNG